MIRIKVGEQVIAIPPEVFGQQLLEGLPGFITGKTSPAPFSTEAAIKSGLKGILPMVLTALHKSIVGKGLDVPAPNLKSKEARENVIMYALSYMLAESFTIMEAVDFNAEGVMQDGTLVITGLSAAPATLGETERTVIADGDERPGIAPPDETANGH